jgi:hypothetical protein
MGTQLAADVGKPPPNLTREDWETLKRIAAEAPQIFRAAASSGSMLALCLLAGKAQELKQEAELLVEKHPELDATLGPAIKALGKRRALVAQNRIEPRNLVGDLVHRCRGTSREQRPAARRTRRTTRARSASGRRSSDDPSPEADIAAFAASEGRRR